MSNGGGGSHTAIQKEQGQVMPGSDDMPYEVDLSQPNVARMYGCVFLKGVIFPGVSVMR